jgi:hypothetical protein
MEGPAEGQSSPAPRAALHSLQRAKRSLEFKGSKGPIGVYRQDMPSACKAANLSEVEVEQPHTFFLPGVGGMVHVGEELH